MGANSHCFNVDLATSIGLPESIILQHFYWWYQRALSLPDMNREGRAWFFRSVAEIHDTFPYLSEANIRTAIKHLCDAGLVIKGDYSGESMNKATWYSLADSAIQVFHLSESLNAFVESTNGFVDSAKSIDNRNKDNRKYSRKENTIYSGKSRFTIPTQEEVEAYCRARGNSVDPQHFIDYYEANGWRVGKNPMKDWRAAVRTWEARRNTDTRQQSRRESVYEHNARVWQEMFGPQTPEEQ